MSINIFDNSKEFVEFKAGQTIFEEGNQSAFMYVVKAGEVQVAFKGKVLDKVGVGGIIGEMGLIDSNPHSASVIALTDCELVQIDRQRFVFLVQQTPYFSLEVMKIMADRLRRMNNTL